MGKWDQYKEKPIVSNPINWEQYKVNEDSWPSLIDKSILKGVTSLADIPKNVLKLAEGGNNLVKKGLNYVTNSDFYKPTNYTDNIPDTNDARKLLKDKLDWDLEPHPSDTSQRIVSHALDFASSGGPLGLIGKTAKGLSLIDKFKRAGVASSLGGTIGGTSAVAQELGVDPLLADIGASIAIPTTIGATLNAKYLPGNLLGLSPKELNKPIAALSKNTKLDLANAAKSLDIDLPVNVVSGSRVTNLADQLVGKAPYMGDKLRDKYRAIEPKVAETLSNIYDEVGPQKTEKVRSLIKDKYVQAVGALPEKAMHYPAKTIEQLDYIKDAFAGIPSLNKYEKSLLGAVTKIEKSFSPYNIKNIPIPVKVLEKQKRSLNAVSRDLKEDVGVQNLIKEVRNALGEDIVTYGKTNPEWYSKYDDANKFYASVANRKDLESHLSQSINSATSNLKYNELSKLINSPKYENILTKTTNATPETLEKIKKLGILAEGLAVKNVNVPNPSGTAMTSAIIGMLASPIKTSASIGGVGVLSNLLTNKKFLDNAITYAQNPTLSNGFKFNAVLKNMTGYSAISLNKALSEDE